MKIQRKLNLLGCSFSVQTEEPSEHLERVIFYLERKLNEIQKNNPGMEPLKIALQAALNLTDELLKLKSEKYHTSLADEQIVANLEIITERLLAKLDSTLPKE